MPSPTSHITRFQNTPNSGAEKVEWDSKITIAQARQLLGDAQAQYSDEQILRIFTLLKMVAHLVYEQGKLGVTRFTRHVRGEIMRD